MNINEASQLGRDALLVALTVGGPTLFATMLVGTIISLFQAVTQVHETTLTFLPKMLVVCGILAAASGWMAQEMVTFGAQCFEQGATR